MYIVILPSISTPLYNVKYFQVKRSIPIFSEVL